jgi:hypothetical protein
VISQDLLDELWDFSDPKGSEQRLRAADTNRFALRTDRNELATQIARALGMQSRFAEALIARSQDPRLERWARDFHTDLGDAMYDGGANQGASAQSQHGRDSGQ